MHSKQIPVYQSLVVWDQTGGETMPPSFPIANIAINAPIASLEALIATRHKKGGMGTGALCKWQMVTCLLMFSSL